jgi:hypothetical protein
VENYVRISSQHLMTFCGLNITTFDAFCGLNMEQFVDLRVLRPLDIKTPFLTRSTKAGAA